MNSVRRKKNNFVEILIQKFLNFIRKIYMKRIFLERIENLIGQDF
jgi:hypothetical protein